MKQRPPSKRFKVYFQPKDDRSYTYVEIDADTRGEAIGLVAIQYNVPRSYIGPTVRIEKEVPRAAE